MMFKILALVVLSAIPAGLFTLTIAIHRVGEILSLMNESQEQSADAVFRFVEMAAMNSSPKP